ncbi:MAG: alpha/beta hydrolase-fold protein [Ilumatobacteraceae bacterium]
MPVAAIGIAVVGWRSADRWRRVVSVLAIQLCAMYAANLINQFYGYEPTRPQLPVVVTVAGVPGQPVNMIQAAGATSVADQYAAAHGGHAPILVFADPYGSFTGGTECVDGPLGNAETYLTVDVPHFAERQFAAASDAASWGIVGYSAGGTCAMEMALGHPDVYGTFVDNGARRAGAERSSSPRPWLETARPDLRADRAERSIAPDVGDRRDDLEAADVLIDEPFLAELDQALAKSGRTRWTCFVRSADGACVGGTEVTFEPDDPATVRQQNTGVDPAIYQHAAKDRDTVIAERTGEAVGVARRRVRPGELSLSAIARLEWLVGPIHQAQPDSDPSESHHVV